MHDIPKAKGCYQQCLAAPATSLDMLRQELSNPDALVRHVAAIQLIFHHPTEVPEATIDELTATFLRVSEGTSQDDPLVTDYTEATLNEEDEDWHDLQQDIALAFARLPANPNSPAIAPLVRVWQDDRSFYEAMLAAVVIAFPLSVLPVPPDSLNETQKSVLRALVPVKKRRFFGGSQKGEEAIWRSCEDTVYMLAERGLPNSPEAMRAYLHLD
jgi:hypothetical protein